MGFIKWVVQIDILANEVLYDITDEEVKPEEKEYDVKTSGSLHKWLENIVQIDILAEDYIRQLLRRYNNIQSEKNQNKLEIMCFKNHHLVFYHVTDILRLISYLCFKTPSLSLLYHFVSDRVLLGQLKDIFISICDVLGNKDYLEFYVKVLDEIEKRIKNENKNEGPLWDWIREQLKPDKYESVKENEEEDGPILEGDDETFNNYQDQEDMHIIFSNINDTINTLFATWDKIFILHGKNTEVFDWYSVLMQNYLSINSRKIEFKNSLQDADLLEISKVFRAESHVDIIHLMTVKSILPSIDINFDDHSKVEDQ